MATPSNQRDKEPYNQMQTNGGSEVGWSPRSHAAAHSSRKYAPEREAEARGGHPMRRPQAFQAHEMANEANGAQNQPYHVHSEGNPALPSDNRRQERRRSPRFYDYHEAIMAEQGMLETLRGGNQRRPDESEVEEEQGDDLQPGCLDALCPKIKRLFGLGAPSIAPEARIVQIGGGQFNVAHTINLHIYQGHPPT